MKKRTRTCLVGGILLAAVLFLCGAALAIGGYLFNDTNRPAPIPTKQDLFAGVTYHRRVYYLPNMTIAHVLVIDTKEKGISLLVTPPDNTGEKPLNARTTSEFLREFGVQIAVNGDGFSPWYSNGPLDYYPHSGDPVTPNGFAASAKQIYSQGKEEENRPTLYISRRGALSFNQRPGNVYSAISGDRMLVLKGEPVAGLDSATLEPRTAVGINRNGRWLYLIVVDGRQPFYSQGASFETLAEILVAYGAYQAMNLDGGGSSTMVITVDGEPQVINSPIDHYIPGTERPVANHLGVYTGE
ncbi:MAG: phosphodiester glycosidase family protein [Anaerolineales bacterium]|nr:phosphodiester glycosidase family protein [Anaerolineales bacterium]